MKKIIIIFLFVLTACNNIENKNRDLGHKTTINKEFSEEVSSEKDSIYIFYKKWKGTPYLWGGTDKFGIDCSAFIQILFKTVYNFQIPRTTTEQMEEGRNCGYINRQLGDLIFFKTSPSTFHVGIYYENDNFIHSASSEGVTMSNLNDSYWKQRYLKIRRIRKDE